MGEMIAQTFDATRQYGKTADQIKNTVKIFALVLQNYQIDQIRAAFVAYLQNHPEMPTPSDILGYIRRGNRRPYDRALYVALCQKRQQTAWSHGPEPWQRGDGLTDAESRYIADFEAHQMQEITT